MEKIIFLDIDGVLNSQIYFKTGALKYRNKKEESEESMFKFNCRYFDIRNIELLNDIIEKTNAKIVYSSSWRKNHSVEELNRMMKTKGFKYEAISSTPVLSFEKQEGIENRSVPRGCEIKSWLESYRNKYNCKMEDLKYVILDDDSDMLYWQRENFFWIDPYSGLTPNISYKVIRFLNRYDKNKNK